MKIKLSGVLLSILNCDYMALCVGYSSTWRTRSISCCVLFDWRFLGLQKRAFHFDYFCTIVRGCWAISIIGCVVESYIVNLIYSTISTGGGGRGVYCWSAKGITFDFSVLMKFCLSDARFAVTQLLLRRWYYYCYFFFPYFNFYFHCKDFIHIIHRWESIN